LNKTATENTTKDDTQTLAAMVRSFQNDSRLYFLSGGGSNQHNQLLLNRPNIDSLIQADDAHTRTNFVLPTRRTSKEEDGNSSNNNGPKVIYAGGGHSGMLTKNGKLYLWGWNENLQCAVQKHNVAARDDDQPLPFIEQLKSITVEKAALGFSHTLVVEKQTGKLFAFGNDVRGQVTGRQKVPSSDISVPPVTPEFLQHEKVEIVAAGLFHSAIVTQKDGELITFGCDRFGQSNLPKEEESTTTTTYRRWKPNDARIVGVALGRRHTVVIDSLNRIWTFGENKYGQLGRTSKEKKKDPIPSIVDMKGKIGEDDTVVAVYCGWSHSIIHIEGQEKGSDRFFGFGRNDKGQLGTGNNQHVNLPIEIFSDKKIKSIGCGSESTMIIDGEDQVWGCGWNEHGNIGTGDKEDAFHLSPTRGVKTCTPPGMKNTKVALAVGGAHYIVAPVEI